MFHTDTARMLSVFYLNLLFLPCGHMLPWWWVVFRVVMGKPTANVPRPRVVPHPLLFPGWGAGGGPSLGQPKIFRCGSLCCCVGDCVVGDCHLYPLHSWQDILLTFAEMELDSTSMFPPGTSVIFIRSTGEPVLAQVVGHSEHGDVYRCITCDRDGKTVLHDRACVRRLSLPRAPSPPRPAQSEDGVESDVSSLTSAKELPDAPTTDDDSDVNSDTEVVWVKSACGVWGMVLAPPYVFFIPGNAHAVRAAALAGPGGPATRGHPGFRPGRL